MSNKDKAHFVEMSYGSLMEVVSQLQIAMDLGYISQQQYEDLQSSLENISYKLYAIRRTFIDNKKVDSPKVR
jgi:four helix bundle protein